MKTEPLGQHGHHPDPLIDANVECDRLEGLLYECYAVLRDVNTLNVATPNGQRVKINVRSVLDQHGAW